jgi:hypothetical protein
MAIEAVASVSTQGIKEMREAALNQAPAREAPAASATEPSLSVNVAPPQAQAASGFTDQMANRIYDAIDKVGVQLPQVEASTQSRIDKAKAEISPQSEEISAGPKAETSGEDGIMMISRTFDHAIFMASVNQVLSGVSDTARTLVKQQ